MLLESKTLVSIARAIVVGLLWVNGPVFLFLVGPVLFIFAPAPLKTLVLGYPVFWILAWLWWSVSVPRWRLWAYRRVTHVLPLKRAAVRAGLIWPDGSFFEKTEIKSAAQLQEQRAWERRKP